MTWHYPDHRDGTTVCVLTDTHFGYREWTAEQLERVGADLDYLAPYFDGCLHAGDGIHWGQEVPEDGELNAWLSARRLNDLPWLMVPGNHDFSSFAPPYPWRTAADWAAKRGQDSARSVQVIGGQVFIGLAPDEWTHGGAGYGPMVLTEEHVAWLDYQVGEYAPMPCWVVCHVPLPEQYTGHLTAPPSLNATLARHNVSGWISGHRHHNVPAKDTGNMMLNTYGANTLVSVNCPSVGGKTLATLGNTKYDDIVWSAFVTMTGAGVTVRWRDHLRQRWGTDSAQAFTRTL